MSFIHDDFLLDNETAKYLYHNHAKKMPIIDYHCHLSPKEIAEDKTFKNITEVWLGGKGFGDHYKWRLMRTNGVEERFITGNEPDFERFKKWADTVKYLFGNPLYHWTHLELKRYFDIDLLLNPDTAKEIYETANKKIANLSAIKFIESSNVEVVCTTDDPIDDLKYHKLIKTKKNYNFKVLPAWRPDVVVNIELDTFNGYINKLAKVVNFKIENLNDLEKALRLRIDYFHENDCRLSDHGIDQMVFLETTKAEVQEIFRKRQEGKKLSKEEIAKYKGYLMTFFGREYHRLNWVQQYHIGAIRDINKRQFNDLGKDSGYDAIQDNLIAEALAQTLNSLDATNQLPKTIIYTLNPRDFEVAITIMQAFQGGGIAGKLQFGAPWWFLDNEDGIEKQFRALANNGLLSKFVGMLTDSRSFLSYPRHEYFRRVLCNYIGKEVEKGRFPNDRALLGKLVEDISYNNAKNYFGY
ncbi:MAG: glucuronate isomerase [Acholeplasmataceae bacterium]|jgi:glucuronate isomerase|nr:glucuronate isomerase [Acholeplasmataceae bacterium]